MAHRVYRALLRILPRGFRDEFAQEMTAMFDDERRGAHGVTARLGVWMRTLWGLGALAVTIRVDQFRLDGRDAVRSLRRQPVFATTIVLTLALAFGPGAVFLGLLDALVLRPLPLPDADRVHVVWRAQPARGYSEFPWSELNALDMQRQVRDQMTLAFYTRTSVTVGGDTPQQVRGTLVSGHLFEVLGLAPPDGRGFVEAELEPGGPAVAMASSAFLRARTGQIGVGSTVRVDGRDTLIIGRLPEATGVPELDVDLWLPLAVDRATSGRGSNFLTLIGRLAPGMSIEVARERLSAAADQLARDYPTVNGGWTAATVPLASQVTRTARRTLWILGVAAAAIGCLALANVAALMLVRTSGRQGDLAVRAALGAGRARLGRQLLVEHALLSSIAGVVAIVMAAALVRGLDLAGLITASQAARVLSGPARIGVVLALITATTAVLGRMVSHRFTAGLPAVPTTTNRHTTSRRDSRLRLLLLATEVAAALVLLVGAGVLLQSSARLLKVDPGFDSDGLWSFQVTLPAPRYQDAPARVGFVNALVEQLRQYPGVTAATSAGYGPMTSMRATRRFAREDAALPEPGTEPQAVDVPAGVDYQRTLGLTIVDGRWFEARDTATAPPVVVISEALARRIFADERAVGRRLRYFSGRPGAPPPPAPEIVGVVTDVRQFDVAEAPLPQVYTPHAQRTWNFATFFVRIAGTPDAVTAAIARLVRAVDPERPVERLGPLSDVIDASTADRRALSTLLLVAALTALLIAAVGVYGVTAAAAAHRSRELAIRTALGAERAGLFGLVVRDGLGASLLGIGTGLMLSLASARALEAVLFETAARDPWILTTVAALLLATCAVATLIPARRALALDPARLLKTDT